MSKDPATDPYAKITDDGEKVLLIASDGVKRLRIPLTAEVLLTMNEDISKCLRGVVTGRIHVR